MRFFSQGYKITSAISIFFLLLLLSGCAQWGQPEKPRFVIVLLDETASFVLSQGGEVTPLWPEVLPWTAEIVNTLQGGDKFCVIGIDGHGFDTDDIRIPIERIDENPLKAIQQKNRIIRAVKNLTPRPNAPRTDILGALYHSAYLLNKHETHQGIIVIFSDMIQTPRLPTLEEASELNFSQNTKVYCFYVHATGRGNWNRIVNTWKAIFEQAGVVTNHFYQRGETSVQFNKFFQKNY